jgi:arginase
VRPISIIEVPFHLGRRGAGMGLGPARLVHGVADALRDKGHQVFGQTIAADPYSAGYEMGAMLAIDQRVADAVSHATHDAELPMVFVGDCFTQSGVLAGLGDKVGLIWFDAHGDFNTPDTSLSGYLNGMALATAAGRCWRNVLAKIPTFSPVDERNIVLAGSRSLDAGELDLLSESDVHLIEMEQFATAGAFEEALEDVARRVNRVSMHIDLDVLDPRELTANRLAVADGASVARVAEAIDAVVARFTVAAVTFSSYDPAADERGHGPSVAMQLALSAAR